MSNQIKVLNKDEFRGLLDKSKERIEGLLPVQHRQQAERFINRAVLTFATHEQRDKLARCKPQSLVQCVLEAAERGFALDNNFVYVIPYGDVAQCQFDYKALIALARRPGTIQDVRAQVVYEGDEFDWYEENGKQVYRFKQARSNRGNKVIGAFAVAVFPDGNYRFAFMDFDELEKVHRASKSPKSPAWTNWRDRMYAKAVVKRVLVGLQDDPGLIRAIELDNREYDMDRVIDGKASPARIQTYDDLADALDSEPIAAAPAIEHHDDIPSFGLPDEYVDAEPAPVRQERPVARTASRPSIGNHPSGVR